MVKDTKYEVMSHCTSLDDLNDELLLEIIYRLTGYDVALRCKTVCKRWCSLISDPLFVTQALLMHRKLNHEESSWHLGFTITEPDDNEREMATITKPSSLTILPSHKISLHFFPSHSRVSATFRDLFLCYSNNWMTEVVVFTICNPVTKQWLALPPCETYLNRILWTGLVCQEGHGFRVVVVHSIPSQPKDITFRSCHLLIYLSETREWRNVEVKLPVRPKNEGCHLAGLSGVVCKGMVCLRSNSSFGAFNPFDVTPTFQGPLIAIGLPLPEIGGQLLESCGKLVALGRDLRLMFYPDGTSSTVLRLGWPIYKLDFMLENDEQALKWENVSCLDDDIKVEGSKVEPRSADRKYLCGHLKVVCVHPTKEHLVYLQLHSVRGRQNELVLCDTRSKILKLVTSMPYKAIPIGKLDFSLSCWPTPIPGASSSRQSFDDESTILSDF